MRENPGTQYLLDSLGSLCASVFCPISPALIRQIFYFCSVPPLPHERVLERVP
jgi:hypothetical protein